MTRSWTPRDIGLAVAGIALLLDQATKLFMLYGVGLFYFRPGQHIPLLPFFNLVMVWNPGISYGLFPAHGALQVTLLVFVTLAIVGGLGWWLFHANNRMTAAGLGLAIGGAIGNNLIDRPVYGRVADFFHFYVGRFDWYVFNVADAAITFGMIALLYEALKVELHELKTRRKPG